MKKIALTSLLVIGSIGSAFAQTAPNAAKKSSAHAKSQPVVGCKLVGTVRGTKLWAGDCAAPDQLRSSVTAIQSNEPPVPDQTATVAPADQK